MGHPATGWRTLGVLEFMRVPSPAASRTAIKGGATRGSFGKDGVEGIIRLKGSSELGKAAGTTSLARACYSKEEWSLGTHSRRSFRYSLVRNSREPLVANRSGSSSHTPGWSVFV